MTLACHTTIITTICAVCGHRNKHTKTEREEGFTQNLALWKSYVEESVDQKEQASGTGLDFLGREASAPSFDSKSL